MAGSKSNYAARKTVEHWHGGVAIGAVPAHLYLALCTAAVDDTSTGATIVEATYGSYGRTEIGTGNNQTDAWNAASGTTTATVTNKNLISCPTATSGSSNVIAVAVVDSAVLGAGNVVDWASISPTTISTGGTPTINPSSLSIVED